MIAMAAMTGIALHFLHSRARQPSKIDTAVHDILSDVRAVRRLKNNGHTIPAQPAAPVVELHSKAHLRLMANGRPPRCAPPARTDQSSPRRRR